MSFQKRGERPQGGRGRLHHPKGGEVHHFTLPPSTLPPPLLGATLAVSFFLLWPRPTSAPSTTSTASSFVMVLLSPSPPVSRAAFLLLLRDSVREDLAQRKDAQQRPNVSWMVKVTSSSICNVKRPGDAGVVLRQILEGSRKRCGRRS